MITKKMMMKLVVTELALVLTSGCGSAPFSVSGGFMGANVSVAFPDGITKKVPVVETPLVSEPTIIAPVSATSAKSAVVNDSGTTAVVPVVTVPNVSKTILAVPVKGS